MITGHMIIRNEDLWVWYSLQSVLPFLDKILIYDTGSTDRTVEIINQINSPKIVLEKRGPVSKKELVTLRQQQVDQTKTEWLMLVDGDEIWPEKELKKLLAAAEKSDPSVKALFNRTRNCIGDVFHYLPDSSGRYQMAGIKGNLNLRLIRKTPDLKVEGVYPLESYEDSKGPLTSQDEHLKFVDCWYLHTSFLKRSSGAQKTSGSLSKSKTSEIGLYMNQSDLPEVLLKERPEFVQNPLYKRSLGFELQALFFWPLILLKNMKERIKSKC